MANPVALDLSVAKTLFAFGERAAKHGLVIPGDLQQFIDKPEKMARLVKYAKEGAPFYQVQLPDIDWPLTYLKLDMEAEAEAVKELALPPANLAIWWEPMVQGVTSNRIIAGLRNLDVKFWLYADDLDTAVPTHDRDPKNGSYVVGFRRTIEADEENKNLSADQLRQRNHKGITLPERLLLEAGFFVATGDHLDINNTTLCTGSRYSVGNVPYVSWDSGYRRVYVCWHYPDGAFDFLRSRSVVS